MNPGFSGNLSQEWKLLFQLWQMDDIFLSANLTVLHYIVKNKLQYRSSLISGDFQCATAVGTHTICQHCYGNNRGFKAGGIIQS